MSHESANTLIAADHLNNGSLWDANNLGTPLSPAGLAPTGFVFQPNDRCVGKRLPFSLQQISPQIKPLPSLKTPFGYSMAPRYKPGKTEPCTPLISFYR
jgi:hypothetical protein